jgi:hypothetical protein
MQGPVFRGLQFSFHIFRPFCLIRKSSMVYINKTIITEKRVQHLNKQIDFTVLHDIQCFQSYLSQC